MDMTSNLSLGLIKQSLMNQQCMMLYEHHQPQFQTLVKGFKSSKNPQIDQLEYVIELLCNVIEYSECHQVAHEIIVLINSILNLKNQLVVKIAGRRKTIFKIISHFKDCVAELEGGSKAQTKDQAKRRFEIYATLHFITIILNHQSREQPNGPDGLFQNKSFLNTIFSVNTSLISEKESIYLISIIVFLLVKNVDLNRYSSSIKQYILQNITSAKQSKARRNFIETFRRLCFITKIEEKEITRNGILEWVIESLKQKRDHDNKDLVDLTKLILIKAPSTANKLVALGLVEILEPFFTSNPEQVCMVYDLILPYTNQETKQNLHSFFMKHISYSPQNTLKMGGKLVGAVTLFQLIKHVQGDILIQIKDLLKHNQSVSVVCLAISYLQNLIKSMSKLSECLGYSLTQKIFLEGTLSDLQSNLNERIQERYSSFKKLYYL